MGSVLKEKQEGKQTQESRKNDYKMIIVNVNSPWLSENLVLLKLNFYFLMKSLAFEGQFYCHIA